MFSQQNLIVNGNCDSIIGCPENAGQIDSCFGWSNYSQFNSSDYLNTCSSNSFSGIPSQVGYQIPHSGNGFIHIIPLVLNKNLNFPIYYSSLDTIIEYRESFIGTLKQPLLSKRYKFECFINYSDFSQYVGDKRLAVNSFDLKLLDSIKNPLACIYPYIDTNDIINLNPSNLIINDTINWIKLSVCFEAKGGERYFALGCMRDSSKIEYTFSGNDASNIPFYSSYYFDSFSLIECDTCCGYVPPIEPEQPFIENLEIANSAGGGSKPVVFTAHLLEGGFAKMEIFDSRGRIVERHTFSKDENTFTPSINLQMAVYHYRFETTNGFQETGKIVIVE